MKCNNLIIISPLKKENIIFNKPKIKEPYKDKSYYPYIFPQQTEYLS
jgi:hypothetical protein